MKVAAASLAILTATLSLPPPTVSFAHPSIFSIQRHGVALQSRGGGASSFRSANASIYATATTSSEVVTVPTAPIAGMRPGTSGLRKKVEVWQGEHYVENFIQCLIDTAVEKNGGEVLDTYVFHCTQSMTMLLI